MRAATEILSPLRGSSRPARTGGREKNFFAAGANGKVPKKAPLRREEFRSRRLKRRREKRRNLISGYARKRFSLAGKIAPMEGEKRGIVELEKKGGKRKKSLFGRGGGGEGNLKSFYPQREGKRGGKVNHIFH